MQRLIAALLLVLSITGAAQAYDDPKVLLEAIYAPYQAGAKHESLEVFYSARLKQLFSENVARHAVDETGQAVDPNAPDVVAFNPFIEGDNSLLMDLAIGDAVMQGDHATALVSFHNFDHPSLLSIAMVKEADGWKVDDIASLGGGENWLLSWLLQYDPFGVS